ncbi:membrane-associated protein [Paucibacter oligotrophus]|uniref:Membrane-associated protein n=1 Tax=Roseateles oligotrophus TaxID=1769250 RepID=A0A840LBQ2_9BURK|nr:VTT domain-containing protein [Roseateles oligotrophus]MBB4844295.1 membrane-associated protein [Roseateles oligotrophus]
MEYLASFFEIILHADRHLADFVALYGNAIYALLFLIIFIETGLVLMPFLPGDSLLFIVGTLCGTGLLHLGTALTVMLLAAVAGNQTNYAIGRFFGPKVFQWESSRWFNRAAFDRAHDFYERRGGIALVLARFIPFARTFAPFVAGVTAMTRRKFTFYDVSGALLWIGSVTLTGYVFGNANVVKTHLPLIFWTMIAIPGLLLLLGFVRTRRNKGDDSR